MAWRVGVEDGGPGEGVRALRFGSGGSGAAWGERGGCF